MPRTRTLMTTVALLGSLTLPLIVATPAVAATKNVSVSYQKSGSDNKIHWHVTFRGTVRPKGATGYTIDGELNGFCEAGSLQHPYIGLKYGGSSKPWEYQKKDCDDAPIHIRLDGSRRSGEGVAFEVGANSGLLGVWQYGEATTYSIGTH